MSVRTTSTTGAVSMSASTSQATTGAPAMMDSCWPTMATTVWVSAECWQETFHFMSMPRQPGVFSVFYHLEYP